MLLDPADRGGSSALTLGDSEFPRDVGRKICCGCCSGGGDVNVRTRSGGGEVKFRTLVFDAEEGCFVEGTVVVGNAESDGNRILLVSRMKATVDSSFPVTLVADSPPRMMSLSREVVIVWPQRGLGPMPILLNENHRRARKVRMQEWTGREYKIV